MRTLGPPAAAIAALILLAVLRFVDPDTRGIMLFAVIPISLLGAMLGVRAGVISALFASAVVLVWAATNGEAGTLEYVDQPLTFFLLGGMSGFFAQGSLGDYDLRRARATGELRRALQHHEVELHYQPIVRLPDQSLWGVEALARWQHPRRGLVPPSEFIPVAEADRQTIRELTLATVEMAALMLRERIEDDGVFATVNLSPVSLRIPDLADAVEKILDDRGLEFSRMGFEVTEGAIAEGEEIAVAALSRLRARGTAMIAVDDFGVGYSSLGRLTQLPIDVLKIDRQLIMHSDEAMRAISRGIVELGHAIDLKVIAEGVEDQATLDKLVEMGCDSVQGFYVSRPMPEEKLLEWVGTAGPAGAGPTVRVDR